MAATVHCAKNILQWVHYCKCLCVYWMTKRMSACHGRSTELRNTIAILFYLFFFMIFSHSLLHISLVLCFFFCLPFSFYASAAAQNLRCARDVPISCAKSGRYVILISSIAPAWSFILHSCLRATWYTIYTYSYINFFATILCVFLNFFPHNAVCSFVACGLCHMLALGKSFACFCTAAPPFIAFQCDCHPIQGWVWHVNTWTQMHMCVCMYVSCNSCQGAGRHTSGVEKSIYW